MKNKITIIIISLGVLVAALAIGMAIVWSNLKKSEKQNVEIQELIALEQEEMLNDLQTAQMEYDELKKKILSNDSLLVRLEQEQLRTQQLYEELQSTKATNAAEIKRLKKELKTLRGVLENYMVQIDSLFRENTVLKNENSKLIEGKKKVEQERNDLAKEKREGRPGLAARCYQCKDDIAAQHRQGDQQHQTRQADKRKLHHLKEHNSEHR